MRILIDLQGKEKPFLARGGAVKALPKTKIQIVFAIKSPEPVAAAETSSWTGPKPGISILVLRSVTLWHG